MGTLDKLEEGRETADRATSLVDWLRSLIDWIKGLFGRE